MVQWLIRGMVFLGSLLMVYNIFGFVRFARYVKKLGFWSADDRILYVPILLLVCFLLGYLAVGIFGKPDLIIAGILFGGSVFVFVIYNLLNGITQRIVEREHLEAELLAAEESNQAKSRFMATMSHEMRTPLNAVIGLNELALKDESLTPQTRDRLEKVEISARHLLNMINDILDMNQIESGEMALKAETFSPMDLLNLVNVLARMMCEEKGLVYRHEVVGELEKACVGDSLRLRQVLLSILSNAVKYTPEGGTVHLVAEQLPREGGRCVLRFTVSDTGVGIAEAFIPKLFEAFAQEDANAINRSAGSGIGLTLTKRLVDMMDGDIAVTSRKGEGSTFVVTVRTGAVDVAGQPDQEREPRTERSLAGKHILIVEDIDLNAELLEDLLALENVTCERAENGRKAVDTFSQAPPGHFDAILMDLRMPVMGGLEATRAIRALPRDDARTVPIIALTANAFEKDVRQSLEAGMNAHLSKPVDTDQLYKTLRTLVA